LLLNTPQYRDRWLIPALILTLLLVTAAAAIATSPTLDAFILATSLLLTAGWTVTRRLHSKPITSDIRGTQNDGQKSPRWHPTVELLLYLSPVIFLGIAYPLIAHRISHDHVGGVPLATLLLASSVTVPWLTQAVCLPLYKALAVQIADGDTARLRDRLCDIWPSAFLRSVPTVAVFAIPIELATGWSLTALVVYVSLCVLYVAFAQSLILSIVLRDRLLWALAWGSLAVTLLIVPSMWFLPPVVAIGTQLIPLRKHLHRMTRHHSLDSGEILVDLVRGLLLGSVLWADKLLLFVKDGSHFAVTAIFMALLPAVLAYNYYFVRLAPRFDSYVGNLRTAMEDDGNSGMVEHSRTVSRYVATSLNQTGLAGASLVLLVTLVSGIFYPSSLSLVATVAIASWLFMMTTLACYKLDYIGQRVTAQFYSGLHLLGCIIVFSIFAVSPALYGVLIALETVIFAGAFYSVHAHWRSSEYSLFWRHATAW